MAQSSSRYPPSDAFRYNQDIQRVIFTADQIAQRIAEMGAEISKQYAGKRLLLVGLTRGAYHILSDLSRQVTIPHAIDTIGLASYEGAKSSHKITLYHSLHAEVKDMHVLLVEDLVDTAFTLSWLINDYFGKVKTGYSSLAVCCLLDKVKAKKVDTYEEKVKPLIKFIGFPVENVFVVGYGMDYNQHYRSLPYIGVLKPEIYKADWEKVVQGLYAVTKEQPKGNDEEEEKKDADK